ncbi:MAG: hypothetical protein PHF97_05300 [Bacteroidales bacterium]|nr:hypothetical protein [Bacteroidales bacterium]MDD4603202.1 hypothetical protein [Bacteroidales bacterium]
MRSRITILLLLLLSATLGNAQTKSYAKHNKGYFCDVGAAFGATFPKNNDPRAIVEVYTTHGYQFSNTFSLGAGVATYNTENINIYLQLRFNLRNITESKTHYTYIALRGGYSWSTWTGDAWGDDKGPIVDPRFGWSFYTKEANLRWSVYLAPSFYQFHFIPKIGLSFEF